MFAKSFGRALALLTVVPSASFALGLGDLHLQSSLNAPLDAEIELVDVTPEEMQSLKAQIASRDTFARYGLDWPVFLSGVQVRTQRAPDGREYIKLKSNDAITEPFITLLVEVNWARGRLVREYTMLLDPPVYTPGQGQGAAAPVTAPNSGAGAHEGAIARSETVAPVNPATASQSSSTNSTASPSSSGAAGGATASPGANRPRTGSAAPISDATEGSSHLVKRGETLSAIAAAAAGTGPNATQTHSWMLAIYQANPAAFEKNMNLLRSGAVLRIPESSAISAISPAEANSEIRRQYAAWRSNAPAGTPAANEPGHLRLVTPSETGGVGAGNNTDVQALQGRVKDLEGQLGESKRLLELRNAELARLQAQVAKTPPAAEAAPVSPPATAPAAAPAAAAPPAATPPAPSEQPPAQVQSTPAPAAEQAPPPAAEPAPTPAQADKGRVRRPHAAPAAPAAEGGSIFDTLKEYWWALALLLVAALALFGVRTWRSRRQSEFDDSLGRLAVAGANALDRDASGDTSPVRPLPDNNADAFVVEESGSHERPRIPMGAPGAARHVASDETISSETAINLDQGDPLAEADFHMAYGLYDQAADLIRIAISREPNRRDLKLKLLEVFFVWGNREQFLQSARELADSRDQAAPGEWEKIVIMGKQLAPDDPLFAGGSAVSGATAGGVDLDLEGGESRVDFDLLGEPVPGHAPGDVDLDIGSALGAEAHDTHTGNTDRNLNINDEFEGVAHGATSRQLTQKMPADEPVMPEYGADSEGEGPTIEQPAIGSTPETTARQKVAVALKQGNASEQTAELAIDDLGLDLGALDTVDQPGIAASSEAPTLVAGMDERSRRVMEQAQRRAASEDHDRDHDTAATAAFRMDDSELHTVLAKANGHAAAAAQFDASSTARLKSLSSHEVDFDLGESEADADGMHRRVANGGAIDLDVGTTTLPEGTYTSTQKLPAEDLALPDLEPVTMSEVGTKLDLARAYMDMGDPEGARNILEEVLHEGSVAQKQEAQRLIESLPG